MIKNILTEMISMAQKLDGMHLHKTADAVTDIFRSKINPENLPLDLLQRELNNIITGKGADKGLLSNALEKIMLSKGYSPASASNYLEQVLRELGQSAKMYGGFDKDTARPGDPYHTGFVRGDQGIQGITGYDPFAQHEHSAMDIPYMGIENMLALLGQGIGTGYSKNREQREEALKGITDTNTPGSPSKKEIDIINKYFGQN